MRKAITILAVLAITGVAVQAEILTIDDPDKGRNVGAGDTATLTTGDSPIVVTSVWMSSWAGGSGVDGDYVLTGEAAVIDLTYTINGGSEVFTWTEDLLVPELADDTHSKGVQIDIADLNLMANSTYEITMNVDSENIRNTYADNIDVSGGDPLELQYTAPSNGGPFKQLEYSVVPEPATMSLLGLGGLVALRRRRRA